MDFEVGDKVLMLAAPKGAEEHIGTIKTVREVFYTGYVYLEDLDCTIFRSAVLPLNRTLTKAECIKAMMAGAKVVNELGSIWRWDTVSERFQAKTKRDSLTGWKNRHIYQITRSYKIYDNSIPEIKLTVNGKECKLSEGTIKEIAKLAK